jgi:hypothetical protein
MALRAKLEEHGWGPGEWLGEEGIDIDDFERQREHAANITRVRVEKGLDPLGLALKALFGSAFMQGYALALHRQRAEEDGAS